ncbi:MAG: dihydrofolate reductase [Roseinatronobacter sp.]
MLSVIVACARKRAIGRDGTIPWHAPEDLRAFMRETLGGAVIMGRATWDSLPRKPLPQRLNIVVTSRPHDPVEGVVFTTLDRALAEAQAHSRVYAIGGAGIYAAFLPSADRLLITDVALDVPDADTFFPPVDPSEWCEIASYRLRDAEPACVMREFLRKQRARTGT